jgi:Kef-type K+ transport system membrane component KefB
MSFQVLVSTAVIAATVTALAAVHGPGAIILGGGLALSSTAVAMQVLARMLYIALARCLSTEC